MSCILWLIGEGFDVDSFEQKSGLTFDKKTYKGQKMFKTKPDDSRVVPHSSLSVATGNAGFDEFEKQVEEAIAYLEANFEQLKLIKSTPEIQQALLDFGADGQPDRFSQELHFTPRLVELAGALGIGLTISIYSSGFISKEE